MSANSNRGLNGPFDKTCKRWQLRTKTLQFDRTPAIMGIVNVTPDSFSDGGRYFDSDKAIEHGLKLIEEGADILDVGGESTRPYSAPVETDEELRRTIEVVKGLAAQTTVPISIDTSKAVVARAAIDEGAEIVNDVTGLEGDPQMIELVCRAKVGVCAMHMQGTPQNMQDQPQYQDVVVEIFEYLERQKKKLIESGLDESRICLDPGIGFGKTHEHNLELVKQVSRFHALGCPVLVGHSRKGFIAKAMGNKEADRTSGTLAVSLWLARRGVQILRVHDVLSTKHGLAVFDAIGGIDGKVQSFR